MRHLLPSFAMLGLLIFLIIPTISRAQWNLQTNRFSYSHPQMGTLFTLSIYAADSAQAGPVAREVWKRIDALNAIMSDYLEESELSLLSAASGKGKAIPVSADLWKVLAASQEMAVASKGSFDVTVGPLSKLWRRAFRQKEFPTDAEIKIAKKVVGYKKMQLDTVNHTVLLPLERMQLDLGAIAKGYALNEAMSIIRSHNLNSALVQAGGDLIVSEAPPGQPGWQIYAKYLTPKGELRDTQLYFTQCAIATSGALYRFMDYKGKKYSHIINPKTGMGVTHGALVSVQSADAMLADALASTVSVMGPRKGEKWLRKYYPQCKVQITYQEKGVNKKLGTLEPVN